MAITKMTLPGFDYLYENFNDDIPEEILPEGSLTYAEVIEQTLTKPEILREKPSLPSLPIGPSILGGRCYVKELKGFYIFPIWLKHIPKQ